MKPRTEVRVSELKNEHNGRNRTYDMRSEDRSATCCHHRYFHHNPKIQHFSESPNQKQIIITYGCKKYGKPYKKTPKCIIRKANVMYLQMRTSLPVTSSPKTNYSADSFPSLYASMTSRSLCSSPACIC